MRAKTPQSFKRREQKPRNVRIHVSTRTLGKEVDVSPITNNVTYVGIFNMNCDWELMTWMPAILGMALMETQIIVWVYNSPSPFGRDRCVMGENQGPRQKNASLRSGGMLE